MAPVTTEAAASPFHATGPSASNQGRRHSSTAGPLKRNTPRRAPPGGEAMANYDTVATAEGGMI